MFEFTRRKALAAATVASILAAGASFATQASAETVLRVIPHADLKNVDPIWTTAYITRNHGYMVYDTLFAMDENLKPQPQMVGEWSTSDDGLVWTFTLRDGLKWHDGGDVTAEDCIASLKRWGARDGMGQQLMAVIESMEASADDAKTFTMTLKEPYGLVLDSIGKISSNVPFMMPKRLAETDPFEQVAEIIGSGPFKFEQDQWVPGAKVVYTKFDEYVPRDEPPSAAAGGKVAKVDRVEWLYIPDSTTAMNALMTGEVDYYEQVPGDLAPLLAADPNITVEVLDPLGNQGMMRMNHLHPPFDNKAVRQAVLASIEQETYMQAAVGNPDYYQSCYSIYACGSPLEMDAPEIKDTGLDKAKAMLAESGYDGTPVVLMQPTDVPILSAFSLVTAERLRKIGMEVDLQAMDWSTLTSRRAKQDVPADGGWNIFHTWWIGGDITNPVLATGLSGGGKEKAWFGWPDSPEIEELRAAFARETDADKQMELAAKIQETALDVVTHGNVGTFFVPVGYRNNVKGLIKSPVQFFWNVEVER